MTVIENALKELNETVSEKVCDLDDRVAAIEANADRPGRTGSVSKAQDEYKSVFVDWLRHSHDRVYEKRLSEAAHDLSRKDVTISTPSQGGYALPEQISRRIEDRVRQLNPFRQICRVEQTSTNDFKALVSMGDGGAGWVAETGTRSETDTPSLRERAPTMGELYAYPEASEWSLDDIFFDVESWLVNDVSNEFSSLEATAFLTGNGTARPTGIYNTTPVSTADDASPLRDAAAIQYKALSNPTSPLALDIDDLIDLVGSLKERYLTNDGRTAFVMHRLTAAYLRKLKSSTGGDYLWEPSSQVGQPDRLLGYPVFTCDAMDQISDDNHPVLFGNFGSGYLIADRVGMRILVDPYSHPGYVRFYVRKRLGGCVLNNDAIKTIKIAES